jgi:hypothetical protein
MVIAQSDKEIITVGARKRRLSRNRARIFKTSDICYRGKRWKKSQSGAGGELASSSNAAMTIAPSARRRKEKFLESVSLGALAISVIDLARKAVLSTVPIQFPKPFVDSDC